MPLLPSLSFASLVTGTQPDDDVTFAGELPPWDESGVLSLRSVFRSVLTPPFDVVNVWMYGT